MVSLDINPDALERLNIKLPALEIEWGVSDMGPDGYLMTAAAAGDKPVSFRLATTFQRGTDLEWATQHMRMALEAAWHAYRKNTDK